ncbi:MAG: M48 family metalloprotease [Phycisphaerales bacterium]|nr:MAG: M48 family metalloprotease [Phycisphaerales bacterium]
MQLFPIVLVAVVLAASEGLALGHGESGPNPVVALVVAWALAAVILLTAWIGTVWCCRRIDGGSGSRPIVTAEHLCRWSRTAFLINHALAVFAFGWLEVVRDWTGDLVLIDELITMMPPILGYIGAWWVYYPVESRLRRALLIRRLDNGQPVYSMPSRTRYVLMQWRLGLLLLLVPLLIIMGLAESVHLAIAPLADETEWIADLTTLVAALLVFLYTPLLARRLLHLTPLPAGPLRDDMLDMCRRHNVAVRDVLLWRTSGSMINAAVMGLLGRLRYVLLTDVLLETLSRRQVQAVMAHEIGHVRRHHIPWLLASLLATVALSEMLISGLLYVLDSLGVVWSEDAGDWLTIAATVVALIIALQLFGWVSRRFERQADTFSVVHLSRTPPPPQVPAAEPGERSTSPASAGDSADPPDLPVAHGPETGLIGSEAVTALQSALGRIAQLNAANPRRRSWRHGSIAWRQDYLQSLIGRPLADLPAGRVIRRIKITAIVVLLIAAIVAGIRMLDAGG